VRGATPADLEESAQDQDEKDKEYEHEKKITVAAATHVNPSFLPVVLLSYVLLQKLALVVHLMIFIQSGR